MSIINNGLLLASGADAATTYQISRSIRLNSADSAFFSRTPGSAGNRRTWTWAAWYKSTNKDSFRALFFAGETGLYHAPSGGSATAHSFYWNLRSGATNYFGNFANVYRDPSAWMHIVWAVDTTQATASNRSKLYVNGVQLTTAGALGLAYCPQNDDLPVNNTVQHTIGAFSSPTNYLDGYLADVHLIDGQALDPSSFTETDAITGQLIPKAYTGSYGTNGFRLTFSDNSGTTSTTLGKDAAGSNNWTPNNFSVASGSGNDSLVDSPTSYGTDTGAGGEVRGNYCTLNPLSVTSGITLSNGNLDLSGYVGLGACFGTIGVSSGKWYWEVVSQQDLMAGVADRQNNNGTYPGNFANSCAWNVYFSFSGNLFATGTFTVNGSPTGSAASAGSIVGLALDMDAGTLKYYVNGVAVNSGNAVFTNITGTVFPVFRASSTASSVNFGQRQWAYAPPSGFRALCDTNLPAPTIAKPADYFDAKLYTGNSSTQTISGYNFSPDFVWLKCRSDSYSHRLFDQVRGTTKVLYSNLTAVEDTISGVTAFNSDGFTLGSETGGNISGQTFVAWAWDAASSNSTNTSGTITSTVRANATAGFSIVSFSSGSAGTYTVGHGLGAKPHFIITKARNGSTFNWAINHISIATTVNKYLAFTTSATLDNGAAVWGANLSDTNSTTFGISSANAVEANKDCIAYCFAPVAGYSAFGSYTGNGSSDGPFVFTGFRPRWVLLKASSAAGAWILHDTARTTYNVMGNELRPDDSTGEYQVDRFDVLSNGFKVRSTNATLNTSSTTYVYMAFAESPFQYARAR